MKFLLKAAFWLSIVVMLLPSGEKSAPAPQAGAPDAVSAASATLSDMRQFCGRQPDACAVGSQAATVFGQKAQVGAKMLYEFLNERTGPNQTGSVGGKPAASATQRSQHTLTPDDLAPAWRGPELRRDGKRPA